MGRRSQHTPSQLRELILDETRKIIERGGLAELSARQIAREIGYAPGTLYNVFANLDDILLHVEADCLGQLGQALAHAVAEGTGVDALRRYAAAYVAFAYRHPRIWSLLQEHHPPDGASGPEWYLEKVYAPVAQLEPIIATLIGTKDPDDVARAARLMWSAIHGIVQVGTTAKFGALSLATTASLIENFIECYVAGLAAPTERPGDGRPGRSSDRAA